MRNWKDPQAVKIEGIQEYTITRNNCGIERIEIKSVDPLTKRVKEFSVLSDNIQISKEVEIYYDVNPGSTQSLEYVQHEFCISDVKLHTVKPD